MTPPPHFILFPMGSIPRESVLECPLPPCLNCQPGTLMVPAPNFTKLLALRIPVLCCSLRQQTSALALRPGSSHFLKDFSPHSSPSLLPHHQFLHLQGITSSYTCKPTLSLCLRSSPRLSYQQDPWLSYQQDPWLTLTSISHPLLPLLPLLQTQAIAF